MEHKAFQQQLFAFHDGELAEGQKRLVEQHLTECAECRMLLAQWKQIAAVCFEKPKTAASERFVSAVMQRLSPQPVFPFRLSGWLQKLPWLVPALGLAAMLFVTLTPLQQAVSIEYLLLGNDRQESALQQVLSGEAPSEEILGLLMEDAT